jgi:hypothetical protein
VDTDKVLEQKTGLFHYFHVCGRMTTFILRTASTQVQGNLNLRSSVVVSCPKLTYMAFTLSAGSAEAHTSFQVSCHPQSSFTWRAVAAAQALQEDESLVSQIMGWLTFVRPFLFGSGLSNRLTGTLPLWPRNVCPLCLLRYLSPHLR